MIGGFGGGFYNEPRTPYEGIHGAGPTMGEWVDGNFNATRLTESCFDDLMMQNQYIMLHQLTKTNNGG